MDPWIRSFGTLTETQDEVVVRTGFVETMHKLSTRGDNPIAEVASAHGAGVARGNGVSIFSDTGAFLTTAICCLGIHARHRTLGEAIDLPAGEGKASLPLNWAMAIVIGCSGTGGPFSTGSVRHTTIAAAHVILVGAVLALTYGNHLGEFG
ncbi:MAG: hypothetical protein IAE82_16675 [Opitutaceae bacterium]|nr:hypothetical protein [Opitutaceae bacterium]